MIHSVELNKTFIDGERNYWRIPGMAVILIQPERDDQILCLGFRDMENQLPVDENTQFCVASCSKSMTAAMLCRLADKGKLSLDEPVKKYAPDLIMQDKIASEEMTLRDILCHRTGLGGHDAVWPGSAKRKDLARRVRHLKPNMKFREKAQYSNLMYAMAGYVAEEVMGQPWNRLMKTYLFEPLRMKRTSCMGEEIIRDRNHAEPYQYANGYLEKLPFWNVDLAGPAASVNMAPVDMARWLHFHIDGGKNAEGVQLIGEPLFSQMHEKQMPYVDSAGLPDDYYPGDGYGLGWVCGSYRGHRLQKHSGKIEGYSTLQAYLPDEKVGVGIMINLHSPSSPIFYTLLYTILDQVLGYENVHWEKRFRSEAFQAPMEAYRDCRSDLTESYLLENLKGKPMKYSVEAYPGDYFDPGYGQVTVWVEDGSLLLHYRDQLLPLYHWGEDLFWMEGVKEDILTLKVPVTAVSNEDGKIEMLRIRYEPLVEDIEFKRI